ncbi:DNA mismatch repair protein Mlh3 isoform X2 [Paramisgurnus dabryanus]|uniref:DNA mismatch repair protein Mlh3 isoform X2 n=1 Tax=Paramisgurnus dabryanus TaxID=90735 RepID=UPI0031F3CE3C
MIKSLPKDVQAQLRSGVTIFSLQQCIEELILNSIDSGATCVAVKIDVAAFKVQVIDNGSGMCREDMEKVGIRYNTSKCSTIQDLDNLRFYGFRGEAISSIVSLAEVVEINSRTKQTAKTYVKRFNETKESDVFEAQTVRPSAGTTVSVCNLFHNMPVRRKRIDDVLETERIRKRMEAISLMHPSVSFTLKKENSSQMVVQLSKTSNTFYRFVQIHGLSRAQKLGEVSYAHEQFEMTGHIGREGHYNNSLQFLFVNGRLLLKTRIHKILNSLLKRVNCTARQNNSQNTSALTSSPKQRGGTDLYGVYVLNIKCHYSEYDICLEPAKSLIEFKDWDNVLICVEEGVKSFLAKENLVMESSVNDIDGPTGSRDSVRSVKTPAEERNIDVNKTHEGYKAPTEKNYDMEVSGGVQMHKHPTPNTEGYTSEESEMVQSVSLPIQTTLPVVNNSKTDVIPDQHVNAICIDSNSTVGTETDGNSDKISVLYFNTSSMKDERWVEDSLKQFSLSNKLHPRKRKLPLNDTARAEQDCHVFYGPSSKSVRTEARRKLTLSFETGSLDKFRRLFGKDGDKKQPSMDKSSILYPESSINSNDLSVGFTGLEYTDRQVLMNIDETVSAHTTSSAKSSLGDKADNISLNAKRSHLKCDKETFKLHKHQPSHKASTRAEWLINESFSCPDVQDFISDKRSLVESMSFELEERSLGNDQGKLLEYESSEIVDLAISDPFTENPDIDLIEQSTKIPSALEDSHLCNPCRTSFGGGMNTADEVGITSEHIPMSNSAIDEWETINESRDEAIPVSSNWLSHYDSSLGKLVYINQVTGLSKYNSPPVEEAQVPCTTDITNMMVSVISKTGFEYRCYPFQTNIVLPFLPKPRAERALCSLTDNREDVQGPNSLSALFSEWTNPVFIRPPEVALDITSGQAEGLAVKIHNILYPCRFTRNMIHTMKVINQVDKKFLACLINTAEQEVPESGNLLVLVDQHAAHERVRLEGLVLDSYEDDPDTPGKKRLCSSSVTPPLEISVTEEDMRLLRSCQAFLRGLALDVSFLKSESLNVLLERLPTCFIEKENAELQRGRQSVIKTIAEDYLREQIELLRLTGRVRGTLPLTVHNVLASQACHGAIKFNHILSKEECCSLVSSLSSCQLPFQCAHGRPSIVPLADLYHLEDQQDLPKPNLRKLRRMYKAWQLYGKDKSVSQN